MANLKKTYVVTGGFPYREHSPGAKFTAGASAELETALATGVVAEASADESVEPEQQEEAVGKSAARNKEKE